MTDEELNCPVCNKEINGYKIASNVAVANLYGYQPTIKCECKTIITIEEVTTYRILTYRTE